MKKHKKMCDGEKHEWILDEAFDLWHRVIIFSIVFSIVRIEITNQRTNNYSFNNM